MYFYLLPQPISPIENIIMSDAQFYLISKLI